MAPEIDERAIGNEGAFEIAGNEAIGIGRPKKILDAFSVLFSSRIAMV
jgi:hypothetical protein